MRFVIVGPVYPYRGGIAHYTSRMAQAAIEEGHEVKVISFARQYPRFLYPGKSDRDPSQEVMRIEADYLLDPLYPWTWERAIKEIDKFSPELVVIQWWTTFWAPAFGWISYRLRNHIKVAFLIHNVVPHEARFFDPWLAKLVLRQGNKHIVQSESQRQRLKELLPKADPVLIEHPLYDQFAEKRMSKEEARRRLGLPEDRPVLLFFGIVRPYKGLTNLIEALALVYQEGYSPLLIVAGEFWEDVEIYKRRIKELGLQEAVRIYNYYIPNEEVPVFFSAADVFVAPYTGGTQSGALKIALAFGLPVVASEGIFIGSNMTFEKEKKHAKLAPRSISESITLYIKTSSYREVGDNGNLPNWSKVIEHILYAI
uniref:Glycosyltransferase n=1 Tax=Bellilinea caldifistulae TaxID=360411 RepID=A0A7C4Q677_9CHLR